MIKVSKHYDNYHIENSKEISVYYKGFNFIVFARTTKDDETVYDLKNQRTGLMTFTWAICPADAYRCAVDMNVRRAA